MTSPRPRPRPRPTAERRSTYERALDMLEARSRATDELRRLLLRKGEPAEEVDAAIDRLVAAGLLDDANYARQMARARGVNGGMSRRRLVQDLSRRGVDREISTAAIDEVFNEEGVNDSTTIDRVARKKLRTLSGLDAPTRKRRLYGFLARRGFDSDDIQRTLIRLIGTDNDSADEST